MKRIILFLILLFFLLVLSACFQQETLYSKKSDNWDVTVKVINLEEYKEEHLEFTYLPDDFTNLTDVSISFLSIYGLGGDITHELQNPNTEKSFGYIRQGENYIDPVYEEYEVRIYWKTTLGEEFQEVIKVPPKN